MKEFQERINLTFPLEKLSQEICKKYNLGTFLSNKLIEIGYEDYNYILNTTLGKFMVKVFNSSRTDQECIDLVERMNIAYLNNFPCPKIYKYNAKNLCIFKLVETKFRLCVMEYINGDNFFVLNKMPNKFDLRNIAKHMANLNQIEHCPPFVYDCWSIVNFDNEYKKNIHLVEDEYKQLIDKVHQEFLKIDFSKLKYGYVHGDIIETNVLVSQKKLYFIDFSVANYLPRIVDLAVTICDLCIDDKKPVTSKQRTEVFVKAYQRITPLDDYELCALNTFIASHQCMTILECTREKNEGNNSVENEKFLNKGKNGLKFVLANKLI